MEGKNLIPFEYSGHAVRVIEQGGEPWFVAKDVCAILGLTDVSMSLRSLDDDEKGTSIIGTPGGSQKTMIVNEPGLYSLILRSRKPEAKTFKRWITHEVIPQIRKTGSYTAKVPQTYADALQLAADQARELEAAKPKIEFADAVMGSKQAIEMKNAAKVLDMGVGRNNLFSILRQRGVLMSDNTPYQEYIDRGYFRVVEQKYTRADGETRINFKTLVYQRGIEFIRRILREEKGGVA